jgi:hypothetical protein
MRWRIIASMTVVLVFILSSSAASQQWVDIKDPKELRTLHSNKTVKGNKSGGVTFVEHYYADGKGIRICAQQREPFTWEVKGNDQVCLSLPNETECWQFKRSKKNREEYVRTNPSNAFMEIIKVEDGTP